MVTRLPSLPLAVLAGEMLREQGPIVVRHDSPGGIAASFRATIRRLREAGGVVHVVGTSGGSIGVRQVVRSRFGVERCGVVGDSIEVIRAVDGSRPPIRPIDWTPRDGGSVIDP